MQLMQLIHPQQTHLSLAYFTERLLYCPIDWDKLDFDLAHYRAFVSLVHPSFKDKALVKANKSILNGGVRYVS